MPRDSAVQGPRWPWRAYGHRGLPGIAPENTLASFREAAAAGASGVELDVQLTRDGCPVVMHDDTVERTTNGTGRVAEHTLADLRSLSAGGWFDARYDAERVPTLAEVLAVASETGLALDLELKATADPGALVAAVADVLARHGWDGEGIGGGGRLLLTSFETDILTHAARALPRVALGYLAEAPAVGEEPELWARAKAQRATDLGAQVVLPHIGAYMRAPSAWSDGPWVLPWCGPLPANASRATLGDEWVVGAITDDPTLL